jgi:hypothetical protein
MAAGVAVVAGLGTWRGLGWGWLVGGWVGVGWKGARMFLCVFLSFARADPHARGGGEKWRT